VEDNERERQTLIELIGDRDIDITAVGSGQEALEALHDKTFRCMVLDLGLPDTSGLDLLQKIKRQRKHLDLPIIVYTGRELSKKEETQLRRLAETIIVKDVRSPERLLDETSLFMHRVEAELLPAQQRMLETARKSSPSLAGKKVLVVDDDIRNIFAVTSFLERQEASVIYAENGKDGLALLEQNQDTHVVLMDIMMPEMDGYEAMGRIRAQERFKALPIIALTAKAMRSDREKCIQAGASDYIAKPVDMEHLLSLLRVWLTQ
jgi:CheY-like chemotaxis protein